MLNFQNDIAVLKAAVHIDHAVRLQLAAHHQLRDLVLAGILRFLVIYHLPVPQNHHGVRQGHHLVQPVADENDRDALVRHLADTFEEPLRLALRQHGGGLVQNQKL